MKCKKVQLCVNAALVNKVTLNDQVRLRIRISVVVVAAAAGSVVVVEVKFIQVDEKLDALLWEQVTSESSLSW